MTQYFNLYTPCKFIHISIINFIIILNHGEEIQLLVLLTLLLYGCECVCGQLEVN